MSEPVNRDAVVKGITGYVAEQTTAAFERTASVVIHEIRCTCRTVCPAFSVSGGAVLKVSRILRDVSVADKHLITKLLQVNMGSSQSDFQFPIPRGADGIIPARGMV